MLVSAHVQDDAREGGRAAAPHRGPAVRPALCKRHDSSVLTSSEFWRFRIQVCVAIKTHALGTILKPCS